MLKAFCHYSITEGVEGRLAAQNDGGFEADYKSATRQQFLQTHSGDQDPHEFVLKPL